MKADFVVILTCMTRSHGSLFALASLPLLVSYSVAMAQTASGGALMPKVHSLTTTEGLTPLDAKVEAVEYRGRKAIRVTPLAKKSNGFALIDGVDFRDGTIEADFAVKVTIPPPARMPGFTGIGFRLQKDPVRYDLFYVRPGNAVADDQSYRNHSVQYAAEPDYGWPVLRTKWTAIYESYADLEPGAWTKMKIEVHGRHASLYLNGSSKPSLIVDGLKGDSLNGAVGLWGFAGEESYFSNLKITPAGPEPISNGGEAAGAWDVAISTDMGPFNGTAKLTREGTKIAGTWSGSFGNDLPIAGTWRDGYVEFALTGALPDGKTEAHVRFAGWVDGDAAKGRMKIEGDAEGKWSAMRTR
ncbi:MAG: hypothetical protein JSS95_10410 [Acidobacteria bacterium]|nr:hypothetical protein [Acidobacteriota bacterium]